MDKMIGLFFRKVEWSVMVPGVFLWELGIVGFGPTGQAVGLTARAFGMNVIAADIYRESPPEYEFIWKDVGEIFAEATAVSLHCF